MLNRLTKALLPEYTNEQVLHSSYKFSAKFFIHLIWLLSCAFVIHYLSIEKNKGFDNVVLILSGAFLVYVFTPLKFKKLFLVALTFGIETYLFGFKISSGVLLFILYFVGLTYVKNKNLRIVLVILSAILCVVITSKLIVFPYGRLIIMFGALFLMLRYIYFLYELNYFKVAPVFIDRLCYLFLIPNACFPLFPALSPVEYTNTFYNQPSEISFKRGLNWMTIGIFHLLIYRVIYLYFSPSPYEVEGFNTWIWFILSAYSLIFRLSGLFYLAMGFVQLFGFKLPPIFNHVYFASGFADLWRRVNLYWRAFMIRVFYYPLVFKFKKFNSKPLVFFATLSMFGCTWLLHSWQWYWIKGSYYFYVTDALFWFILGLFVSTYAVKSMSKLNNDQISTKKTENYFLQAAKVLLMFFGMSFLWSLWTSTTLTEFLYLARFSVKGNASDYLIFIGCVFILILMTGFIRRMHYTKNWFGFIFEEVNPFIGIVFCLAIVGTSEILKQNHPNEIESFLSMNINNRDKSLLERGYYEQILNNDDKQIDLMNVGGKFKNWNLDRDAYVKANNELVKEFKPSYRTTFKGDTLSTNSFGIRDKEYTVKKDSNTIRLAFIGGSYVMGSGVSNEENFAALVEEKLVNSANEKVEILNYGVGGYYLLQSVSVVENKISNYNPDYVFCFVHSSYKTRCLDNFANLIQKQTEFSFPYLKIVTEKAGVKKGMCHLEIYNRLKPFMNEVMYWSFKTIYKDCKKINAIPVLVYLPTNATITKDNEKEFCLAEASKAGFKIIDLSEVYEGQKPLEIQISAWDTHPNEKGHQLISDLLIKKLKNDKQFFKFIK